MQEPEGKQCRPATLPLIEPRKCSQWCARLVCGLEKESLECSRQWLASQSETPEAKSFHQVVYLQVVVKIKIMKQKCIYQMKRGRARLLQLPRKWVFKNWRKVNINAKSSKLPVGEGRVKAENLPRWLKCGTQRLTWLRTPVAEEASMFQIQLLKYSNLNLSGD